MLSGSKRQHGRLEGLTNDAEKVLTRCRSRRNQPSSAALRIKAEREKQAEVGKEKAQQAEIKHRKEAWLRYVLIAAACNDHSLLIISMILVAR